MTTKLSLREIQLQELNMLKYFITFCEEHDLNYFLAGGTMLGAIRHKGFIPWDDDIDLLLPREDFEKLLTLHQEFGQGTAYYIASHKLGNLNRSFARMFDKNVHIEKEFLSDENDQFLNIDIFPLDGLPDDLKEVKAIYKKVRFYNKLLLWKTARLGKGKSLSAKVIKPFLKLMLLPVSIDRIIQKIDRLATSVPYSDANYVGEITLGLHEVKERVPKEVFEKSIDVDFEGIKAKGMVDYDTYLGNKYGDYMTIPPESEQLDHSLVAWIEE